jgi:flagellar biosynthetic protein FliO
MKVNRIKIVAIMTGFILAGCLFSTAIGASQLSGQEPNATSSPSSYEQFSISGGCEYFYKMLLSILVVACLGVAVVYVSKKLLPKMSNLPGKQIKIVETSHLGPRKAIHLIQIGPRRLLIGSTSETITMLADVTDSGPCFAAELEKRS